MNYFWGCIKILDNEPLTGACGLFRIILQVDDAGVTGDHRPLRVIRCDPGAAQQSGPAEDRG